VLDNEGFTAAQEICIVVPTLVLQPV